MNAFIEHGAPLVDDPERIGRVRQLGVDETSFLAANRDHPTVYTTGLIDLERHVVIDMVEGNSAADLRRWTTNADPDCLAGIEVVATDLAESFRAGLSPHVDHTRRVADPFHVVRVGNRCVEQVRRRVQNETLGHRGRKADPLYRIRKLLLTGSERLDQRGSDRMLLGLRVGDPNDELLGACLAKESVRDVYLADTVTDPATLLDKAIVGCAADEVPEFGRSARHRHRGAPSPRPPRHRRLQRSNRRPQPVRQERQAMRPRLPILRELPVRVLLHAGGITWPERPTPPRIRTRSPPLRRVEPDNRGLQLEPKRSMTRARGHPATIGRGISECQSESCLLTSDGATATRGLRCGGKRVQNSLPAIRSSRVVSGSVVARTAWTASSAGTYQWSLSPW